MDRSRSRDHRRVKSRGKKSGGEKSRYLKIQLRCILPCKTGYPGYPGYPGEFLRNSGDFLKSSLRGAKLFSALTKIKFFICSMRLGDKD